MALPRPVTATDMYLVAILDELKGLRAELAQPPPPETKAIDLREVGTALPIDFPGYEALLTAGIYTVEAVPNDGDKLTAIKGIGKVTANQILLRLLDR